jgi:YfiH family protein
MTHDQDQGQGQGHRPAVEELLVELPGGGRALFTTRADGNLSTGSGDLHEQGIARREQLCKRLNLPWLCSSRQVHGSVVHVLERISAVGGEALPIDADGHATTLAGVGVMAMAADCLPVALGCHGAVAMLHAGWRGLSAGVLEQGLRTLRTLAGSEAPILAVIGPSAGVCCYEVGPEVHDALAHGPEMHDALAHAQACAHTHARGRHLDLRGIARERLLAAGAHEVRDLDACTICDRRFFSHRREGPHAGRQAGIAWLS